jgi:hypothetical protein
VILVDANILLYAYHPRSDQHERARTWIETTFSGQDPVGLAWQNILAFLRIGTNPRVFEQPLGIAEGAAIVSSWLAIPAVTILTPGERHWPILQALLGPAQVSGPLVMDAAVAALAIEHGATLCTTDRDFSRFPGLRVTNPLEA